MSRTINITCRICVVFRARRWDFVLGQQGVIVVCRSRLHGVCDVGVDVDVDVCACACVCHVSFIPHLRMTTD
jgi:hypothetical protein